ncbi:MAG: hypothetical protein JRG97_10650 [Deltaproteobacteria bacterium]|nr:hypothetical protein [Deltaproteobacteria bacterium]MBW2053186.1 hypothetical protein [Deltaproteobacteria bacterium]MBW2141515.1 hypothetical protein [Deltaproteobacteria bacterium]MBW2323231.1 hypothetical protein [Deltaproteobacteria bacterium]
MAKRTQRQFLKRQKELERKRKAQEKIARRQNKKNETVEKDTPEPPDQS